MSATHADTANVARTAEISALRWKLVLAAVLVGLGDWLFFRHPVGVSLTIFTGAVEAATFLAAGARLQKMVVCAALGAATLAPLVESVNILSLLIASCGAGAIALVADRGTDGSFAGQIFRVLKFLAVGPFRLLLDMPDVGRKVSTGGVVRISGRDLTAWMLPIGLGGVFLALFSAANPVVEAWLRYIDLRPLLALLDIWRIALWLILLALVWPFLQFRPRKWGRADVGSQRPATVRVSSNGDGGFRSILFGEAAIFRSLIVFNLMFAVQTALDVAILWRGHSLPAGISFASYAHRGAYPLMATALLAGAFVILAMRPDAAARRSTSIRVLVRLFTAQNVALVLSSLYRLELYVRVYSLTYWRIAAFVWMGLVAVGLLLILVQISARRSNGWLLSTNAFAAAVALYLCAFVNFDFVIADYNIRHCAQVSNESAALDLSYMQSLGPDAIPAIDAALAMPEFASISRPLGGIRANLAEIESSNRTDWRAWTLREWRLSRYLEAQSSPTP